MTESVSSHSFFLIYLHLIFFKSLGRAAILGCCLGIILGIHLVIWIQWTTDLVWFDRAQSTFLKLAVWQWCTYVCTLCSFHLLEFFVTAIYNPSVASASSFLVNHSTAYTAAAISSWIEFGCRQALIHFFVGDRGAPHLKSFYWKMTLAGFLVVVLAQCLRSAAMVTASESFNHYIQTKKHCNHTLVTHGVYSYLRHPSYTGFFFWSIGTQLVLGNIIHTIAYTIASWNFFHRRIAYEEESLCKLFPLEYPQYVATTCTGIPFVYTQVGYTSRANTIRPKTS